MTGSGDAATVLGRIRGQAVLAATAPRAHDAGMRRIVVFAFDGVQALDVVGPVEVFTRGG